ncbi:MAG: HYExAFE family protein [Sedimentisphaeraceae bacterium JB056]
MSTKNDYEEAFSLWLEENNYNFRHVKQSERLKIGEKSVKSFDYVVDNNGKVCVVELKGRVFKGDSFASLSGLQNWVTCDDVESLGGWQCIEGVDRALLVFAYRSQNIDVDTDGNDSIEYNGKVYVFIAIHVNKYRSFMKRRSRRWNTVDLHASDFRNSIIELKKAFY